MRTFLEVEGKMGPIPQPTSSQCRPLSWMQTLMSGRIRLQRRERGQFPPKDLGLTQPPGLAKQLCTHPQQFPKPQPMSNPQADASENRFPPLEDAPVCKSTPWPSTGKMSGNLFEERKDWLLPLNYLINGNKDTTGVASPKPPIKEEPKTGEQSIISLRAEKCRWGPNCPFYKNQEEDWDGDHKKKQLQQKTPPQQEIQMPQARHPQTLNYQRPQLTEAQPRETN